MNRDPYDVLGVPHTATDDEIKAAYRKMAKKYHPDVNGGSAQAEAKMKEVNEAYTILIKHKGQGYTPGGTSGGYNPYGNPGGGYGGYGRTGGYGNTGGAGSSQNGYDDYDPFGFGDFFRQAGQQSRRSGYTTTYTEYDPLLKNVEDAVLDNNFSRAIQLLSALHERSAAWYYWSARANLGLGNRVAALNYARRAVQMAPDEAAFREMLSQLQSTGQSYRQYGNQRGFTGTLCANPCLSVLVLNLLCNCCCLGGRGGAYCC